MKLLQTTYRLYFRSESIEQMSDTGVGIVRTNSKIVVDRGAYFIILSITSVSILIDIVDGVCEHVCVGMFSGQN